MCRVAGGQFRLTITYVYPRPQDALPGDLARRWKLFQEDNVRHEKQHGRIARKMAEEADRAIDRFAMRDRPNCRKANAALHKELGAIGKKYRLLQNEFDRVEHRNGGPVEKSIRLLIGR